MAKEKQYSLLLSPVSCISPSMAHHSDLPIAGAGENKISSSDQQPLEVSAKSELSRTGSSKRLNAKAPDRVVVPIHHHPHQIHAFHPASPGTAYYAAPPPQFEYYGGFVEHEVVTISYPIRERHSEGEGEAQGRPGAQVRLLVKEEASLHLRGILRRKPPPPLTPRRTPPMPTVVSLHYQRLSVNKESVKIRRRVPFSTVALTAAASCLKSSLFGHLHKPAATQTPLFLARIHRRCSL